MDDPPDTPDRSSLSTNEQHHPNTGASWRSWAWMAVQVVMLVMTGDHAPVVNIAITIAQH